VAAAALGTVLLIVLLVSLCSLKKKNDLMVAKVQTITFSQPFEQSARGAALQEDDFYAS